MTEVIGEFVENIAEFGSLFSMTLKIFKKSILETFDANTNSTSSALWMDFDE